MASTFASLRGDFFARGFDYWNDGGSYLARTKELFNQIYLELCDEDNWPFMETESTPYDPTMGLPTFTGLREVRYVVDNNNLAFGRLVPAFERDLVDVYGDLTTRGTPYYFYVSNLTGTPATVRPYPYGGLLKVNYYKLPAELTADSDEPIIPQRFRRYIVEGMVRVAAQEDAPEAARAADAEYTRGVSRMRSGLLFQSGQPQPSGFTDESLDA